MPSGQGTKGGPDARLRAVDLARTVGISVQQVRNYADQGVLPPVERTENGYRVFTGDHAEAIVAARLMADGHGWSRTRSIMRAVHAGDLESALSSLDRSHAELDRERAEIDKILSAFETVVTTSAMTTTTATARPATRGGIRIGEVARVVGVRTSSLRFWEERGLLRPGREKGTEYRVYDESELRTARIVALLRRGAYPFPIIDAVLGELRTTGSPERVRAVLAERERELHRRSLRRLRGSAALYAYLERVSPGVTRPSPR